MMSVILRKLSVSPIKLQRRTKPKTTRRPSEIIRLQCSTSFMLSSVRSLTCDSYQCFISFNIFCNFALFELVWARHSPVVWATSCVADETQSDRGAQCIRARCADYLDRAEQLKEYLRKKEKGPPAKPIKESQSDDKGWDWSIKLFISLSFRSNKYSYICTFLKPAVCLSMSTS